VTREEKVARAQELRAQGLRLREIAAEMGYAVSTVQAWIKDPDRSAEIARKNSYSGACRDCGAATSGSNGPGKAPERCHACASALRLEWSRQRIIESIRGWADRYGAPPAVTDWSPKMLRDPSRRNAAELRLSDGVWPNVSIIQRRFGSFNAAIEAAGFTPLPQSSGRRHLREVAA
jgi:hypothetical protein